MKPPHDLIALGRVTGQQYHQQQADQDQVAHHREDPAGRVNEHHTTSQPEGCPAAGAVAEPAEHLQVVFQRETHELRRLFEHGHFLVVDVARSLGDGQHHVDHDLRLFR